MWVTVGYMKLYVDRDLNCRWQFVTWRCVLTETWNVGDSWLHEAVCRQWHQMWVTVGYMKLYVERDLKCGWKLVTWSCV